MFLFYETQKVKLQYANIVMHSRAHLNYVHVKCPHHCMIIIMDNKYIYRYACDVKNYKFLIHICVYIILNYFMITIYSDDTCFLNRILFY